MATTNLQQSSSLAAPSPPTGLSVGDMIKIRVWDPLPKEGIIKSPRLSYMHKTSFLQSPPVAPSNNLLTYAEVEFPAANSNSFT